MSIDVNKKKRLTQNEQIAELKKRVDIPYNDLDLIIFSYKQIIHEELEANRCFRFGSMVLVYSTEVDYIDAPVTLAYIASRVADSTNIGYHIVLGVLEQYIAMAEQIVRNGQNFIFTGIFNMKPALDEEGNIVGIYVTLSKYLNDTLTTLEYRLRTKVLYNFKVKIKQ